ncbi:MAG: protoheme IX farnesyltransferase [Hyphomicrobiales bacterium]|nr:protoheme IX farnesyltransferase [Hyphomicrobiales bacterium]
MPAENTGSAKQGISGLTIWRKYLVLCKPKVIALIIFTALAGMLLADAGFPPFQTLFFGLIGIGLCAASGAAINHWVDQRIDQLMSRTFNRPLPRGEISPNRALIFALSIGTIGLAMLMVKINVLTAALTALSLIGYAVIYTMYLKHATPYNIVLGGAAGAAPPLLGWVAVTGHVNTEALLLFLIIFIWTPPHFWALAIKRRKDYAKAGVPMLPVTHGIEYTKIQIILYVGVLFIVTLIPGLIKMSGMIYLTGAIALGVGFIWHSIRLYRCKTDEHAMQTFAYSIHYLTALFGFFLLDHYARLFLRHFVL